MTGILASNADPFHYILLHFITLHYRCRDNFVNYFILLIDISGKSRNGRPRPKTMGEQDVTTEAATTNPKLAEFQQILAGIASNPEEAKHFAATVQDPEGMAAYCAEKGLILTSVQAETTYKAIRDAEALMQETAVAENRTLSEAELENVTGGISWALIGLGAGAILGALTGGIGLALAGAAYEVVGTAILGGVAGGLGGGGAGAAIGGIAQAISNAFD